MSKDDIEKAVREAEQFAEEDKQRKEELDARNGADQMVYQCEKILQENGDKFSDEEKNSINEKIELIREALKGEDINLIKSRQEELTKEFYELSEKLYKAAAPEGAPDMGDMGDMGGMGGDADPGVYDAPFTDVEE